MKALLSVVVKGYPERVARIYIGPCTSFVTSLHQMLSPMLPVSIAEKLVLMSAEGVGSQSCSNGSSSSASGSGGTAGSSSQVLANQVLTNSAVPSGAAAGAGVESNSSYPEAVPDFFGGSLIHFQNNDVEAAKAAGGGGAGAGAGVNSAPIFDYTGMLAYQRRMMLQLLRDVHAAGSAPTHSAAVIKALDAADAAAAAALVAHRLLAVTQALIRAATEVQVAHILILI